MPGFCLHRTPPAPALFRSLGDFGRPYAFRIVPLFYCTISQRIIGYCLKGALTIFAGGLTGDRKMCRRVRLRATIRFVISTARRAVTLVLVGLLSFTVLLAQAKATASKTQALIQGFVWNPVVCKDFGCAEDYVKTLNASGVQRRKMLSDLVEYGCVKTFKGVFLGVKQESRKSAGTSLAKVVLIFDIQMMRDLGFSEDVIKTDLAVADANADADQGWILESDFFKKSKEQFLKDVRQARQPQ